MIRRRWSVLGILTLLGGCATGVSDTIGKAPPADIQIAEVRQAPDTYRGSTVRWGGGVISVRNLKDETIIEIMGRRLDSSGRPRDESQNQGRFLAKVAGFHDPAVFTAGREVTVRGRVEGTIAQAIGEFSYSYPVVRTEDVHLWEPRPPPPRYPYRDPFWHDPWYPGYPFWPYYRPWY